MIKILLLPLIFFMVPSVTDAGNCIAFLQGAEPAETFSRHHRGGSVGETGNDLSDVVRLIENVKVKKTPSTSGTQLYDPPRIFIRPPRNLSPDKNVAGRIPSIFPSTVLLI